LRERIVPSLPLSLSLALLLSPWRIWKTMMVEEHQEAMMREKVVVFLVCICTELTVLMGLRVEGRRSLYHHMLVEKMRIEAIRRARARVRVEKSQDERIWRIWLIVAK